jgi:hypothetical protein
MKQLPRFRPPRARFLTPEEHRNFRIVNGIRIIAPNEQLGLAPLAIVAGVSAAKKVFQKSDPKKDAERDARIATVEPLAMQGNVAAAAYIWQQTGHNGTKFVPALPQINFPGGPVGPGASSDSQYHARVAWQRILKGVPAVAARATAGNFTAGAIAPNAPAPQTGGGAMVVAQPFVPAVVPPATPAKPEPTTIEKIAEGIQTAADRVQQIVAPFIQPPAPPPTPGQPGGPTVQPPAPPAQAGTGSGKALLVAAGVVGGLALLANSGGRSRRGGRR